MPESDYLPSKNIAKDSFPELTPIGHGELPQILLQSVDSAVQEPGRESMWILFCHCEVYVIVKG